MRRWRRKKRKRIGRMGRKRRIRCKRVKRNNCTLGEKNNTVYILVQYLKKKKAQQTEQSRDKIQR